MVLFSKEKADSKITVSESYQICEDITRAASTSFLRSFKSLPIEKRSSVHALYAFCRKVDDIVDGDWLPDLSVLEKQEMSELNQRAEYRAIALGIERMSEPSNSDKNHFQRVRALLWFRDNLDTIEIGGEVQHPIFIALKDTMRKFPIRITDLKLLLEGMEDDLFPTNYQSFEDLRSFCF